MGVSAIAIVLGDNDYGNTFRGLCWKALNA
jgi:hypothetical protein